MTPPEIDSRSHRSDLTARSSNRIAAADKAELLWQAAGGVVVSRLAWPEAVAARERKLTDKGHLTASGALRSCFDRCTTVSVADRLVDRAADLAAYLHLRAADAINVLTALGSEPCSSAKAGTARWL